MKSVKKFFAKQNASDVSRLRNRVMAVYLCSKDCGSLSPQEWELLRCFSKAVDKDLRRQHDKEQEMIGAELRKRRELKAS